MTETPQPKTRSRRRWRWLGSLVGLLVAFLLLLWGNAARLPSRQMTDVAPLRNPVDASQVATSLEKALSIDTYSSLDRNAMDRQAFADLHELLETEFPEAHRVLEKETIDDMGLLYFWPGSEPDLDPGLFMAHLDVVTVESSSLHKWEHGAEQGETEDGFGVGARALDVKCGVVGLLAAVDRLAASGFSPRRGFYLAMGHDEEVGGRQGNQRIVERLKEEKEVDHLEFVMDEGGAILDGVIPGVESPVAFVAIAEKRFATLRMEARGEGGHGSMPGRSAIVTLAEAVQTVQDNPAPPRMTSAVESMFDFLGPEMPASKSVVLGNRWLTRGLVTRVFAAGGTTAAVVRDTVSFTDLRTDSEWNKQPTTAAVLMDLRMLPGSTIEQVLDHYRSLTDQYLDTDGKPLISWSVLDESKGSEVSPVEGPVFTKLQKTIHEVFPDVIVAPGLTSVSTDSRWYYGLTDHLYRFIPMRMKPDDLPKLHGVNERIGVDNFGEVVWFYQRLMENLCGAA